MCESRSQNESGARTWTPRAGSIRMRAARGAACGCYVLRQLDVEARSAEQRIEARAAGEHVVAFAAFDHVVAAIAEQHIVAVAAVDVVVALAAVNDVVALAAEQV